MPTFPAPVTINDSSNSAATIIGRGITGLPINPASVIEASAVLLYGSPGLSGGTIRLSLFGEPGIILVEGAGNTRIQLDSAGQISISDSAESTRFTVDSSGRLTLTDSNGTQDIVLDPQAGTIRVEATQTFPSSTLLDVGGRITLSDAASGGVTALSGNDSTFAGSVGVGGNLNVHDNVTVGGDVFLPGADCAEHFDSAGMQVLEPGTVVVIDEKGALQESRLAYDKRVAGVVSGAGEHRPAIILDRRVSAEGRMPLALVGKAFCKADADAAPIAVGDLLTTSDTPGYAMRADDPNRAFGAVLGKALQPLTSGRGLIPMLIALQ